MSAALSGWASAIIDRHRFERQLPAAPPAGGVPTWSAQMRLRGEGLPLCARPLGPWVVPPNTCSLAAIHLAG